MSGPQGNPSEDEQPWRSMETAPKDRRILLVRQNDGCRTVTLGYWYEEEHGIQIGDCGGVCRCPEYAEARDPYWWSDDGGFTTTSPPIAWMELPEPPQ